jgi:dipeptidyl aminopeptidase/acylaminoacyl peptidase
MHKYWCVSVCFLLLLMTPAANASKPLPVEAFSQLPSAHSIEMSPDGKYIAYFLNLDNATVLATMDLETHEPQGLIQSDNERYKFNWLQWANSEKVIFSTYFPDYRGLGVETEETRLLSIGRTDKEPKVLFTPSLGAGLSYKHVSQFQDNVISLLPDDNDNILMGFDIDNPNYPSVYSVNVNTGKKSIIKRDRAPIRDWIADRQGRVRAGVGFDEDDGVRSIWVHNPDTDEWNKLWEYKYFSQPDITPLGFSVDPHVLYIRAEHNGRQSIFTIDARQTSPHMSLIAHDPDYDIEGGLMYSPKTNDAVGVSHGEAQNSIIYWDEQYQAFQQAIDKALPDTSNSLVSFSRNERQYIVYASSSNRPGVYYYGNRDTKSMEAIIPEYPKLMNEELPETEKVSYQARDGLKIEAYLTLPNNFDGKPIPAIIQPHGGPMVREYGGFDYWTQFFVNRGYAVLQPNFRGSSGYGHEFEMQAVGQYGMAMQDDLTDATNWLIKQGIADPGRICIVGASYGGYAALLAAAKTPDLFQCAISFAGLSDLLAQRNKARNYVNKVVALEQYGRDSKQLEDNSPINLVDKITIPLLLVHGDDDRVVDVEQSRAMVEALEDRDKKFEYIELEHGTHYLDNQQHRTTLFKAMDTFLARYLGE